MTREGATEINKATGGTENISSREGERLPDIPASLPVVENVQNSGVVDPAKAKKQLAKKRAHKRANAKIFKQSQAKPETTLLKFNDERVLDKSQDKSGMRLFFWDGNNPANGKLQHTLYRPGQEASLLVHREVKKSDNMGVEAAHSVEEKGEHGARRLSAGYRILKYHHHRAKLRAEEKVIKANSKAFYDRSMRLSPELKKANPTKKALHKRKIKRDYAKAFRQGNLGAKHATTASRSATRHTKNTVIRVIRSARNIKIFATFGVILLVLMMLMASISSCATMIVGGLNTILSTSYVAQDECMLGVHEDFLELEEELAERIANIPYERPGYDEYRFNLDPISHNPHELISYLTALHHDFTRQQVQGELRRIFNQQYILTLNSITEVRTRTETRVDSEGNTTTVEVQYTWRILVITLVNRSISAVAEDNLTPEQFEMFLAYLETMGNRPDLFADPPYDYAIEDFNMPSAYLTDSRFAAMMAEAEKFIGFPYVWGGSNPATSFDCSGFVSWVINQSGVGSVGRMTANGLYNHTITISANAAIPGDLVFFQGTWNTRGASHVGIYTGGGMMLHAGDPIGFTSIKTSYWTRHFKAFGRLP